MAFDFFTQPRGPEIDINLYPNSASAGINAGNAQKTPLQQVVQGIGTGLDLYGKYQQVQDNALSLELKQNSVDQLPVTNRIQEEALQNAENINDINELKVRRAQALDVLQTDADRAKLIEETHTAEAEALLQKRVADFRKQMASSDPQTQANAILGGQYNDLFISSPKTQQAAYTSLLTNPTVSPDQKLSIQRALRNSAIDDYYQRQAFENQEAFGKTRAEYLQGKGASLISKAARQTGLAPENVPDNIRYEETGKFEIDPNTNRIKLDPITKQPMISKNWLNMAKSGATVKGQYDVFSKAPGHENELIDTAVDKDLYDLHNNYIGGRSLQDGTYARDARAHVSKAEASQTGAPQTQGAQLRIPLSQQTIKESVQTAFNLSNDDVETIEPALDSFRLFVSKYTSLPELRGSTAFVKERTDTMRSMAKGITDIQYEKSPAIQAQYNENYVKKVNDGLAQLANENTSGLPTHAIELRKQLLEIQMPDSPEDLYYQIQGPTIIAQLNQYFEAVLQAQQKAALEPARIAGAKSNLNSFLSKVQSGAGAGR